jgi:AbrB family looped-hinge helix DNA binding protein
MTARYKLKVDKQGRLVLPAEVRAAMNIVPGVDVTLEIDGEETRLISHWQALRALQRELAELVPPGVSIVDELIAERRAEAAREGSE